MVNAKHIRMDVKRSERKRSLKSSLKMPIGVTQSKVGTQFDLSNRYHSQGLAAGGSALLDAINRGKVHLAKFILDAGESDVVNTRDFKGKTPLIRACYIKEEKTRAKAIDLLLGKGADVNIQDDAGRTALSYACELRCNDVVRVLVKNNVDPDIADDRGNTPLMYSAIVGNDTGVEILIRSFRRLGLNVDHVNNDGLTALLIAAKNGFIECASILALEGKACISFRDREKGLNAEEWARSQGCSTPEILPFSTQAAFLNYKYPKCGGCGEEEDLMLSREVSGAEAGRKYSSSTKPRFSVSPPPPLKPRHSKTNKDLDVDELNKKLSQLHSKAESSERTAKLQVHDCGHRAREKRSSLPSIKLFGMFWHNERDEERHEDASLPKLGQRDEGRSSLTPEGGRKHRRKSGSGRGDQDPDQVHSTSSPRSTCRPRCSDTAESSGKPHSRRKSSARSTSPDAKALSPRSPPSPKSPNSLSSEFSPAGATQTQRKGSGPYNSVASASGVNVAVVVEKH